jgi:hypothetical protein
MLTEALKQELSKMDLERLLFIAKTLEMLIRYDENLFRYDQRLVLTDLLLEPLNEIAKARNIKICLSTPKTRQELIGDEFESYCFSYNLINLQETVEFFEKNLTEGLARLMREIKAYPVVG